MESFKQLVYDHVEKVGLALAIVFLAYQTVSSTGAGVGESTQEELKRQLTALKRKHKDSKPDPFPPLAYVRTLQGNIDPKVPSFALKDVVILPRTMPYVSLPVWHITLGEPARYPLSDPAKRIDSSPDSEILGVGIAEDGMALTTAGPVGVGETQVVIIYENASGAIIPIKVEKQITELHEPILLSATPGEYSGVTVLWQDDPRQERQTPVTQYVMSRRGPLVRGGKPPEWLTKTLSKRACLLTKHGPGWHHVVPEREWRKLPGEKGISGDRLYYFDRKVLPNATYEYKVTSQAVLEGQLRTKESRRTLTVRTPIGCEIYPVGTAIAGDKKQASILVLKRVGRVWHTRLFQGVWVKGCLVRGKRASGRIGGTVEIDGQRVNLATPYTLLDVQSEEVEQVRRIKRRIRDKKGRWVDGFVTQTYRKRVPKIVYEDIHGYRHAKLRVASAEAAKAVEAVKTRGPWDVPGEVFVVASPGARRPPPASAAPPQEPEPDPRVEFGTGPDRPRPKPEAGRPKPGEPPMGEPRVNPRLQAEIDRTRRACEREKDPRRRRLYQKRLEDLMRQAQMYRE